MTATFLVTLDLPEDSASSLDGEAEAIMESLSMDGFSVTKVEPWARPVSAPQVPSSFLPEPPASALTLNPFLDTSP